MRIALLTANLYGGIVQFSMTLMERLIDRGHAVTCFIPEGYIATVSESLKSNIITYNKKKSVFIHNNDNEKASHMIGDINPDIVWLMDDSIVSCQIAMILDKGIKKYVTVHDAHPHISYNKSLKYRTQDRYLQSLRDSLYKQAEKLITLSPRSAEELRNRYPSSKENVVCIPLGAHIPECIAICPDEIEEHKDYLLFIGRIDAYKGIGRLLEAYREYDGNLRLVIAGEGALAEKELQQANQDGRILLLNRYIRDEEFMWLIENSNALVLPYIEATQSGLIPIAYYCGKPVITSDVAGLTQFVENKETGYICKDKNEYISAFGQVSTVDEEKNKAQRIKDYYHERFDWDKNLADIGF